MGVLGGLIRREIQSPSSNGTAFVGFQVPNMSNNLLCQQCHKISFQSLFRGPRYQFGPYPSERIGLGTLRRIWYESSCDFCQLVKHTLKVHWDNKNIEETLLSDPSQEVWMIWGPLDGSYDDLEGSTNDMPYYIDIGITGLRDSQLTALHDEESRMKINSINPQVIALRDSDDFENHHIHFGKPVEIDAIDWSTVKDWLISCSSKHPGINPANFRKQGDDLRLRVIDVFQNCVITLPHKAQYIALSYVWGKDQALKLRTNNRAFLFTAGCFNDEKFRPSRTIIDEIQAVRYLGFRYLWVDALCIVQDDAQDVKSNVGIMYQIYSEALFTIAAVAGNNADHGLPGLSHEIPRSVQQKRITVQGITLANRLHTNVNATYWNKRGWTFQERVLSPRLLAFTSTHVTFRCDEGCNHDEQFYEGNEGMRFFTYDIGSRLDFERNNVFEVYAFAVSEYTKRSITNPLDKVRAFDGVLGRLHRPLKCPFLFGLPISIFDIALLWMPVGRCTRGKESFPSWSWAGWTGAVAYDQLEGDTLTNLCERTVGQCDIRTTEANINLCRTDTSVIGDTTSTEDQEKWTRHYDEETSEIYYSLIDHHFSEKESQLYRYPRRLRFPGENISHLLSNELSPVLNIQGRVASFRLTGQHSGMTYLPGSNCRFGHHGQCNLAIMDGMCRVVGRVLVDSTTVPRLQNRKHRFLALSRTTLSSNDEDNSWDVESKSFRPWKDTPETKVDVIEESKYEEYNRPFEKWIAGESVSTDYSHSMNLKTDRAKIFRKDYDGPEENRGPFDARYFSNKILWPLLNVLLLSDEKNGTVERCGIGQIHVDGFKDSKEEKVLLR